MSLAYVQACDANFKRLVLAECYGALVEAGFTRFRKEEIDWPLEGGYHCWVGLNATLNTTYVEISPFVGVHAVPIMKLCADFEGKKYDRGVATYALHLGKLVPNEPVFRFSRKTDISREARRLSALYAETGLTYAMSIGSHDRLLPLLRERAAGFGGYPERTASCLYLMGREAEARNFVKSFLSANHAYFQSFATAFLRFLSSKGGKSG